MSCPHCGHEQPARNDYLANASAADSADEAPTHPEPEAAPLESAANANEADASDTSRPAGLEPISFDELDELEQLLSDNPTEVSSGDLEPEITDSEAEYRADNIEALLSVPTQEDPSDDPAVDDDSKDDEVQDAAGLEAAAVWRVKSDKGLTYSFFNVDALKRWFAALGTQSHALVTADGATWKPFTDFEKQLHDSDDAQSAFKKTQVRQRKAPEPEAPIEINPNVQTGKHTAARGRRTKLMDRKRSSSPAGKKRGSSAESRGAKGSNARRLEARRRGNTSGDNVTQSSQIAFMALGLIVGAAGVYFGMYLLGFYDLTF